MLASRFNHTNIHAPQNPDNETVLVLHESQSTINSLSWYYGLSRVSSPYSRPPIALISLTSLAGDKKVIFCVHGTTALHIRHAFF